MRGLRYFSRNAASHRCMELIGWKHGIERSPLHLSVSLNQDRSLQNVDAAILLVSNEEMKAPGQLLRSLNLPQTALDDFKPSKGSVKVLYPSNQKRLVLVGLGKSKHVCMQTLRAATHNGLDQVTKLSKQSSLPIEHVSLAFPDTLPDSLDTPTLVAEMTKTAIISRHSFDKYKKPSKSPSHPLGMSSLSISLPESSSDECFKHHVRYGEASALGTILARELANERADVMTPSLLEKCSEHLSESGDLKFKVIKGEKLQLEYPLISAVGQSATRGPRLITLEYSPSSTTAANVPTIALVGKGITYDTGGLNLKPTGFIEDMHLDMGGAAAVLGAMKTISLLRPEIRVVAVIAAAENAIGPNAYKPHSIIQSSKGSVQVANTDAEGRLALADALTMVQKIHSPDIVVDIATLTGACVVALGEYSAGLFANDDKLAAELVKIGDDTWERCWRLPIYDEHREELKGTHADFNSTGKGRTGGASTAAAFLERFIGGEFDGCNSEDDEEEQDKPRWAHIDMAGPGMYSAQRDFMPLGGTGFGAQLLSEFVLRESRKSSKSS